MCATWTCGITCVYACVPTGGVLDTREGEQGMGARRSAVGLAVTGVFLAVALFGAAAPSGAASPAVTFDLECSPPILTPGDAWACSGTIRNGGPQTATHVTLVQEIEGAVLADSVFTPDTFVCADLAAGGATCDLGNFAQDDVISFTTIFETSASASELKNDAYVTFDEGDSDQDQGKQDTVCANTYLPPELNTNEPPELECSGAQSAALIAADDQDDQASGYVAFIDGVDTLATTGVLVQPGDVLTELDIPFRSEFPNGFPARIEESRDLGASFQNVIEDLVDQFSTDAPVVLTFRLIAPKGKNARNIVVLHNGAVAQSCSLTPLSESIDTCVNSRSQDKKTKIVTIVVLSTDNGSWKFD